MNKMRTRFASLLVKVGKAFYKAYVILFYYEVLKQYGISHKGFYGIPSPQVILILVSKYLGG